MYRRKNLSPATILIVKTSSLGDIVQAFHVLEFLKHHHPNAVIDWAVDPAFEKIVSAHPLIRKAIPVNLKGGLSSLRKEKYDLLFDLQGNAKSGLITFFARSQVKVGYALGTAREWPNILATHFRFSVSKEQNIRKFYLNLIEQYFGMTATVETGGVEFQIAENEREKVKTLAYGTRAKVMVCPGSKWMNKQLPLPIWIEFLQKIEAQKEVCFFLMWGNEAELAQVMQMKEQLRSAVIVEKLSIPTWQNLMNEMDLILAVDSGALHLAATTKRPSFSIFGPTSAQVFKPLGPLHISIQGACPYKQSFTKQCPRLRTCPTGACMKISAEELLISFLEIKRI